MSLRGDEPFQIGRYDRNNIDIVLKFLRPVLLGAIENQGFPYGGFVRDVLVPHSEGESLWNLNFKDVDLWFTSQENADAFIKEFAHKEMSTPDHSLYELQHWPGLEGSKEFLIAEYTWYREQYGLFVNGVFVALIDVVVNQDFPVNDFDENFLYCSGFGTHLNQAQIVSRHPTKSKEDLIHSIMRKELHVRPDYLGPKTHIQQKRLEKLGFRGYVFISDDLYYQKLNTHCYLNGPTR